MAFGTYKSSPHHNPLRRRHRLRFLFINKEKKCKKCSSLKVMNYTNHHNRNPPFGAVAESVAGAELDLGN